MLNRALLCKVRQRECVLSSSTLPGTLQVAQHDDEGKNMLELEVVQSGGQDAGSTTWQANTVCGEQVRAAAARAELYATSAGRSRSAQLCKGAEGAFCCSVATTGPTMVRTAAPSTATNPITRTTPITTTSRSGCACSSAQKGQVLYSCTTLQTLTCPRSRV